MPMPNDFVEDVLRIKNIEKQLDERATIATNAINRAEKAEAKVKELEEAAMTVSMTNVGKMMADNLRLEKRIKELEALLAENTPAGGWKVLEDLRARVKELVDQNSVLKAQVVALQGRLENQRRRKPTNG